jgi:hypothetical protein
LQIDELRPAGSERRPLCISPHAIEDLYLYCALRFSMAPSTAARRLLMTSPELLAPKMAEPATMTFEPALAHSSTVAGPTPPSTWMLRVG